MKIKSILEAKVHEISPLLESYNWEDQKSYSAWLSQTYHFVKWTTRLLSLAAGFAKPEEENHLHRYFIKHLPEEVGHEILIINDLKSINEKLAASFDSTESFVNQHKKALLEKGSICHLGYMLYLENLSISVGIHVLKRLKNSYPPAQIQFLNGHSEDDIEHVSSCLNFVNRLTTSEQIKIMNSIEETAYGYSKIIEDLRTHSQNNRKLVA